jgi:hypothetical protein
MFYMAIPGVSKALSRKYQIQKKRRAPDLLLVAEGSMRIKWYMETQVPFAQILESNANMCTRRFQYQIVIIVAMGDEGHLQYIIWLSWYKCEQYLSITEAMCLSLV